MPLAAETKRRLIRMALEIVLYALLVVAYLFLILRFLGTELVTLFKHNSVLYAGLALGLMVFQGIFLESVTTFLIERLEF